MNCEELQDHYELYAMGVAGEPEKSEIREHLNRECEVCMAAMKRARALTTILGGSASEAMPSPKLRRRVLASVGYEQRQFGWTPFLAAATVLCLAAAVYFGGREKDFADTATRLRDQVGRQTVELTRMNEAFAILNGPETTVTSFGTGQPQPPKGKVFVNPARGVLLIASNLPPAPAGKVYEMWVIPKGGKPMRAGEFQSQSDGTAIHVRRGAVDVNTTGAVAVTMENEGGADQPTLPILAVAALQ
jgi:hypothetical protein